MPHYKVTFKESAKSRQLICWTQFYVDLAEATAVAARMVSDYTAGAGVLVSVELTEAPK